MTIFQIMFSIIATILMGVMAFIIFILAEHKEEIWKGLYEDNDKTDTTYNK
jgi:hypothetical protein